MAVEQAPSVDLIEEIDDQGIFISGNATTGREAVYLTFDDLSTVLRELAKDKDVVWPRVTPAFQVDTIIDQAAYLLSIAANPRG